MIDITDATTKCFADSQYGCGAMRYKQCNGCKFYKPVGCHDWIRLDIGDRVLLFTPEEYEKERDKI